MKLPSFQRPSPPSALWRSSVCVLLCLLFLYSPFLKIYSSTRVTNLQTTLSYRATIASSELHAFTISSHRTVADASAQLIIARLAVLLTTVSYRAPKDFEIVPAPQETLVSNFWFRPPPIA